MASNPTIFGEDPVDLAMEAVGVGAVALINDRFVSPMVRGMVPGLYGGNEAVGKFIDAGTTGLTAYGLGEAAGMADRQLGRRIKRGGMLLAVAKAISAVVPGFGLSASLPTSFSLANPFGAPPAPALPPPSGNGNGRGNGTTQALGVGSMGL